MMTKSSYIDNWNNSLGGAQFYVTPGGVLQYYYDGNKILNSSVNLSANTWHHLAATRSGTTVRLFADGVLVGTVLNTSATTGISSLAINYQQVTGPLWFGSGYVGEVRITAGVARYTSNFAVPTQAFPSN